MDLGFDFSLLIHSPSEEEGDCQAGEILSQENESNKKNAGTSSGISSVCLDYRPLFESETKVVQQCLATQSESGPSGQALSHSQTTQDIASSLYDGGKSSQIGSTLPPRSDSGDAHRRVSNWVGRPYAKRSFARDLVKYFSDVSHQCPGSDGRIPVLKEDETETRLSHSTSAGQQSSTALHKSKRVPVSPPKINL